MNLTEISSKIMAFADLLEEKQIEALRASHLDCEANINNARTSIKPGRKYVNVDIGPSGRFMVEIATGNIYGIKAYGQIHRGHQYGTVDTIHDWNWKGYWPAKIAA